MGIWRSSTRLQVKKHVHKFASSSLSLKIEYFEKKDMNVWNQHIQKHHGFGKLTNFFTNHQDISGSLPLTLKRFMYVESQVVSDEMMTSLNLPFRKQMVQWSRCQWSIFTSTLSTRSIPHSHIPTPFHHCQSSVGMASPRLNDETAKQLYSIRTAAACVV